MAVDPKFIGSLLGAPKRAYGGDWKRYGMGPEHRFFGWGQNVSPDAAPPAQGATDIGVTAPGTFPPGGLTPQQQALLSGSDLAGEMGSSGWGAGSSIGRQGNDVDQTRAEALQGLADMTGSLASHAVGGPMSAAMTMGDLATATGKSNPGLLGAAYNTVSGWFGGGPKGGSGGDAWGGFGDPANGGANASTGNINGGADVGDPSDMNGYGGGDDSGGAGADAGGENGGTYATGGHVTAARLTGGNPPGPDDGHATLKIGEFVVPAPLVAALRGNDARKSEAAAAELIKRITG